MSTLPLWPDGPVLEDCRDAQSVSTDSVLLADFAGLSGVKRAADLGAGSGLVAILLAVRSPALSADCVELSPAAAALCRQNIQYNGLQDRLTVLERDLRTLTAAEVGRYQLIVSNPPYFPLGAGTSPHTPERREAREERSCTLPELAETAARLLGDGGRLAVVYPAARLAEAVCVFQAAGLTPKRLRLVQARTDAAPSLFLLECRRRGQPGLRVEPTLLLRDETGAETPEVRRIYHREG